MVDYNEYRRKWRQLPHVKLKLFAEQLRRFYDMTIDEFETLLRRQDGVCAICGRPDAGVTRQKRLHVDHVHGLKLIRGLLCKDCNTGLGCFKDTPELLIKAAHYLMTAEEVEGER